MTTVITKQVAEQRRAELLRGVARCLGRVQKRSVVTAKNERLDLLTVITGGRRLMGLQESVGHGPWMAWAKDHLPKAMSYRTAGVWMQVAEASLRHPEIRSAASLRAALATIRRINSEARRRGLDETPPMPPDGKFGLIMADPPWPLEGVPYHVMSIDQIAALPVADVVADDAALFLWRIHRFDAEAHEVLRAWGFEFSGRVLVWLKHQPGQHPWLGSRHESCLIGLRGKPAHLSGQTDVVDAPRGRHSEKPDEAFQLAETIFPMADGHKLELFARFGRGGHYPRAERGWVGWGDEIAQREAWDRLAEQIWSRRRSPAAE